MPASVLLIHGGFHGAWCWERLITALAERGVRAEAVDLPFTTFEADVAAVEGALDRMGAGGIRVVAVAHSLGGVHLTAAGAGQDGHRPAAHLVYLSAAMVDPEELSASDGQQWDHIVYDDTFARADPVKSAPLFYSSCDDDAVSWALARLRPMPITDLGLPPVGSPVAWREIPTSYIVCTRDRMLAPEQQRSMAAGAGSVLELDSDHSPFLSKTTELADMISGIAGSV